MLMKESLPVMDVTPSAVYSVSKGKKHKIRKITLDPTTYLCDQFGGGNLSSTTNSSYFQFLRCQNAGKSGCNQKLAQIFHYS